VLEYVTKPLATGLVIALALSLDTSRGDSRTWFIGALAACLIGDVLLMLGDRVFVYGLAAFLVGHLLFVTGLIGIGHHSVALSIVAVVGALALLIVVGRPIAAAASADDVRLEAPVTGYLLVICVMTVVAWRTGNPWALAGSTAFVGSDALLGWDRFVRPVRRAPVAVMATYHAAIAMLTFALL
jgi:uncharacterized membrane protein YhhN